MHLKSRTCASGSRRRYSGTLIFHGIKTYIDGRTDQLFLGGFTKTDDETGHSDGKPLLEARLVDVEIDRFERRPSDTEVLVGLGDRGHASCLIDAGLDSRESEIAGVREADALRVEHAHAEAALATRGHDLERTLLRLDRTGQRVADEDLGGRDAAGAQRFERAIDDLVVRQPRAHWILPPMTTEGMRSVGCASATGAP